MTSYDEIRYLRSKAHALCEGLRLRLTEFDDDFPAGSPGQLIAITTTFLEKIRDEVEAATDKNILLAFFRLIDTLSSTLDLLDNAHTAQTPRGLVQFLEEIANSLYPGSCLLVSPSSTYNYSITNIIPALSQLAKDALPSSVAASLTGTFPKDLYVVRFPRIERDNVLNHTVFGHEFGHPIADDFIALHEQQAIFAARLTAAKQKIQADPHLSALLAARTDPVEQSYLLSQFVDTVVALHKRGLQELVSDAVGVHLFGISALLAGLDVFGQTSLDSAPRQPQYYPPPRYRLRLMYQTLIANQQIAGLLKLAYPEHLAAIGEAAKGVFAHLESLTSENHDKAEIVKNAVIKIAYEWLDETLPEAFHYAEQRLKAVIYTPDFSGKAFIALVERLALDIPPNEVGLWPALEPGEWRSGLLASWLVAIAHSLDTAGTAKSRLDGLKTVHKLALKGVEYGVIQKQCKEYLDKQGSQP